MNHLVRTRWLDREQVRRFADFEALLSGWPTETCYISVAQPSAQPVDMLWEYQASDSTIVMFHAALGESTKELPVFLGRTISSDTSANRLYIADPAHYCSDRIQTGWFMGTHWVPGFQSELVSVFALVRERFARNRLVFFGPSAGGFASMFFSSYFPGSLAVAVNPQTNVEGHSAMAISALCEDAWLVGPHVYAPLRKVPAVHEVVSIYSRPTSNSVLYVQNRGDLIHMREQHGPFFASLHGFNSCRQLAGDWGPGHVPPPSSLLKAILERATRMDSVGAFLAAPTP